MKNLLIGLTLTFIGQVLIFFQTNGQFFVPWIKNHPFIVSLVGGTLVSYLFITGTGYTVEYFGGTVWENRLLGFGVGMISFSFLTWAYLGEGITTKTTISLMLALTLVLIQILWK
jgi:hypothetical protein